MRKAPSIKLQFSMSERQARPDGTVCGWLFWGLRVWCLELFIVKLVKASQGLVKPSKKHNKQFMANDLRLFST